LKRLLPLTFAAFFLLVVTSIAFGWGSTGHRFINRNGVVHLPPTMLQFISQQTFFESHAMDADNRRSTDTAEAPKHFLDIDYYPYFQNMTRNLDTLIGQYGWALVRQNGINPWAAVWTLDSLTAQLARGDWSAAYLTASDLGHYVADAHQPLHCTMNYNGQLTGNTGIHTRYESAMITNYQGSLYTVPDSVAFVSDPINFMFDYIIHSNALVDSVMQADNYAKAMSGWNGTGTPPPEYYGFLWQRSQVYTIDQIQRATVALASLWYTAWVNAGLRPPPTAVGADGSFIPGQCILHQNFPNPFNPSTTFSYFLPGAGDVSIRIYDIAGREVATIFDQRQMAGGHQVLFNGEGISSGLYFYRLQFEHHAQVKKMILLK